MSIFNENLSLIKVTTKQGHENEGQRLGNLDQTAVLEFQTRKIIHTKDKELQR